MLPDRHGSSEKYRYGFQGQEKDDELKGEGNSLNYTFRMHDPRVGRFFAVDPLFKEYPELTPYQFASDSPIDMIEVEGLEGGWIVDKQFKVSFAPGPRTDAFDNEWTARAAANKGFTIPSQYKSYMDWQARMPTNQKPFDQLRSDDLENQVNQFRGVNPGLAISRGVLDGFKEAPGVLIPEIAFAKIGKVYKAYKLSKIAKNATIAGGEIGAGLGSTGKGLTLLASKLNPSGGRYNCVLVSVEFQKKLLKQVYTSVTSGGGRGLDMDKMMAYLYSNFSKVDINYSYSKSYKILVETLNTEIKSSNSSIIIGKLSNKTGEVTDHAFNAVKNSDGSWKFLDMQTGVQYTEKGMEKTFSSYKIIEVK